MFPILYARVIGGIIYGIWLIFEGLIGNWTEFHLFKLAILILLTDDSLFNREIKEDKGCLKKNTWVEISLGILVSVQYLLMNRLPSYLNHQNSFSESKLQTF